MDLHDLRIRGVAKGIEIEIRALPGAKRPGLKGVHDGRLKIGVTVPPEKGRANMALVEYLARMFGLSRSSVRLVAGALSRNKRFLLEGLTLERVHASILAALQDPR